MKNLYRELSKYAALIVEKGLVAGPGGNISARDGDEVYLSPSGFCLDEIAPHQWVGINLATKRTDHDLRPTCETPLHLGCYLARPEITAVIHTHSPYTIGIVAAGIPFKPFYPDFVAVLGSEIPLCPFLPPGGEELREAVVAQIEKANVVLLDRHGAVCLGESLKEAFLRAWVLEETAKMLAVTASCGKDMNYFTQEEIRSIEEMEAEDYRKLLMKRIP